MNVVVPSQPLETACPECDRPAVTWAARVATDSHLAVVVRCEACSYSGSVRYVNRRQDTRLEALAAVAEEVVG